MFTNIQQIICVVCANATLYSIHVFCTYICVKVLSCSHLLPHLIVFM